MSEPTIKDLAAQLRIAEAEHKAQMLRDELDALKAYAATLVQPPPPPPPVVPKERSPLERQLAEHFGWSK